MKQTLLPSVKEVLYNSSEAEADIIRNRLVAVNKSLAMMDVVKVVNIPILADAIDSTTKKKNTKMKMKKSLSNQYQEKHRLPSRQADSQNVVKVFPQTVVPLTQTTSLHKKVTNYSYKDIDSQIDNVSLMSNDSQNVFQDHDSLCSSVTKDTAIRSLASHQSKLEIKRNDQLLKDFLFFHSSIVWEKVLKGVRYVRNESPVFTQKSNLEPCLLDKAGKTNIENLFSKLS